MTLHEKLRSDLCESILNKSVATGDLKYILGEFARLKGTKDGKEYIGSELNDSQAIRVLKNIIAGEQKLLDLVPNTVSTLIPLINKYLPKQISLEELETFINNIDFSSLSNKMQAVKIVKNHFGDTVDGKVVSDIIKNM